MRYFVGTELGVANLIQRHFDVSFVLHEQVHEFYLSFLVVFEFVVLRGNPERLRS